MRAAVIGHVEWVEFARVESFPAPGEIVHTTETWAEAAGGGAVAAVQLVNLGCETTLFTALGTDELGRRSLEQLEEQGVNVRASIVPDPQRRAFTHIDGAGERTITTSNGTLVLRFTGVFDTARHEFSELERVIEGSDAFSGAKGTLYLYGKSNSDNTSFEGQIRGELCIEEPDGH